jgi:hypothetical protein
MNAPACACDLQLISLVLAPAVLARYLVRGGHT